MPSVKRLGMLLAFCALVMLPALAPCHADTPRVYLVRIHGAIWPGVASFVSDRLSDAWRAGARGVILDLDTTSGTDDAAESIKSAIMATSARGLPVACFIHDRATGPGSLDAIACTPIAMAPGGSLGGANTDESKADFKSTADALHRNPAIAAAFISADSPLPSLGLTPGESLTLTARQAQANGYADLIATDYPDLLSRMGLGGADVVRVDLDGWTTFCLWLCQPWATVLVLIIGLVLVIIEMMTLHSWGFAGIIGAVLVGLIFAAHITVGTATWVGIILVLAGIALLVFETHILPGHGVSAFVGLVLIFIGIYYALGGAQTGAFYSASLAVLFTFGIVTAFFIYLPKSPIWKKIGQPMRQTALAGYVVSEDYTGYLGATGVAATLLRPSGTAEIEGMRLNVVSEGEFIPAGTPIQVIVVQGNRIVVRPMTADAISTEGRGTL